MGLIAKTNGDIVAVKVKKSLLNDEMTNINFLTLTVRTAGAKIRSCRRRGSCKSNRKIKIICNQIILIEYHAVQRR